MATSGKTWSKARASCPRPQHAGSRVRLDGQYGKLGHRRQLYRCVPANGETPGYVARILGLMGGAGASTATTLAVRLVG